MSHPTKDFDYRELSAPERILLAQELWDSVHDEAEKTPPSESVKAEAARRLAELRSGDVRCIPWEDLKKELLKRV